jgi:hypothetical protein
MPSMEKSDMDIYGEGPGLGTYSSILKMEAKCSSKKSVTFYQTI